MYRLTECAMWLYKQASFKPSNIQTIGYNSHKMLQVSFISWQWQPSPSVVVQSVQ